MNIFSSIRMAYDSASYQRKLLFSYLIFMALPVIALSLLSVNEFEAVMTKQALISADHAAGLAKSAVESCLIPAESMLRNMARQEQVREILQKDPQTTLFIDQIDDLKKLQDLSEGFKAVAPDLNIRLYVDDGFRYSRTNELTCSMSNFWQIPGSGEMLTKSSVLYYSEPYDYSLLTRGTTRIITVYTPVRERKDFTNIVGVVGVDIPVRLLLSSLKKADFTEQGQMMILSSAGQTLLSTAEGQGDEALLAAALNGGQSMIREGYAIGAAELTQNGWRVLCAAPLSQLLADGYALRGRLIVFALLMGALVYLLAWRYSRHSVGSILSLQREMRKVQQGDYTAACIVDRGDEIGDVQAAFNTMVRKTRTLLKTQQDMAQEMKALELKVLQSKINPHFLYNTLDLISWSADKPEAVRTIAVKLSQFYRLSLSGGSDFISLKDEFEHIRLYVEIQNLRFQSAIELTTYLEEGLSEKPVMKLLLQPIVENSIVHGLRFRDAPGGRIAVRAETQCCAQGDFVCISISDNGVGINQKPGGMPAAHSGGYGLKNIRERLHIYYGPSSTLTLKSDNGTVVTILIPMASM